MFRAFEAVFVMMLAMVFAVGCHKPEGPEEGGEDPGNAVENHEYVDLGLPSGTLWATCNVGANTPEAFGDYFAWGETVAKEIYDWKSYKYGDFDIEHYALTKYCTDSVYGRDGFVDNLICLEPDDDAAAANWGADWRMPTREEWEELLQYTTPIRTSLNGVDGWRFTAENGNSIFLPAAGYWWDGEFNTGGIGIYWSMLVNKEFPYRTWGLHFNWDQCHICGSSDRNRGQTVRAVRVTQG